MIRLLQCVYPTYPSTKATVALARVNVEYDAFEQRISAITAAKLERAKQLQKLSISIETSPAWPNTESKERKSFMHGDDPVAQGVARSQAMRSARFCGVRPCSRPT